MTKQILITGFPHCGTTVLRTKLGECKNTYEEQKEFAEPAHYHPNMEYDFYIWKHPFLHKEFRNHTFSIKPQTKYADIIIIPIIRNPWNVFSSLYKRGTQSGEFSIYDNKQGHSLSYYNNAATVILDAMKNNYDDVYPIRYEDMFDNNFQALKNIFDKIGLEYNDSLFETNTKIHSQAKAKYIENYDTLGKYDSEYRTWQINQKFENKNSDINLPDDFSELLTNSPIIQELGYFDPRITH
jgi:hypothetical protein